MKLADGLVSEATEQLPMLLPSPMLAGRMPMPLASSRTSAIDAGQFAVGAKLSTTLMNLIGFPANEPQSLAQRNLLRHLTFKLPSGQAVARAIDLGLI